MPATPTADEATTVTTATTTTEATGKTDGDETDENHTIASPREELPDVSPPPEVAKARFNRTLRFSLGIVLAGVAGVLLAAVTILAKYVGDSENAAKIAIFRYAAVVVIVFPLLLANKLPVTGPKTCMPRVWLLLRGLFGATALLLHYSAVRLISVMNATIIGISAPTMVFLFGRIFFREQFGKFQVVALLATVMGIFFVSNVYDTLWIMVPPVGGNHSKIMKELALEERIIKHNGRALGNIYEICQTLIMAFSYIFIRKLTGEHRTLVLFNYSLVSLVLVGIVHKLALDKYLLFDNHCKSNDNSTMAEFDNMTAIINNITATPANVTVANSAAIANNSTAIASGSNRAIPDKYSPYLLILLGLCAYYGQAFGTKAAQLADPNIATIVRILAEITAAGIGDNYLFNERSYSNSAAIGVMLIILALSIYVFRKFILSKPPDHSIRKTFAFFQD